METVKKIYVNAEDTAEIECPHCKTVRTLHVKKFKGAKRKVKMRCRCHSGFHVSFEFRKAQRRESDIKGYYAEFPNVDKWRRMLITNISVTGVGLLTHAMHGLSRGNQLRVRFTTNGARRHVVEKDAVVRWVADGNIGCEFLASSKDDEAYILYALA
jgi:hypothetical protein